MLALPVCHVCVFCHLVRQRRALLYPFSLRISIELWVFVTHCPLKFSGAKHWTGLVHTLLQKVDRKLIEGSLALTQSAWQMPNVQIYCKKWLKTCSWWSLTWQVCGHRDKPLSLDVEIVSKCWQTCHANTKQAMIAVLFILLRQVWKPGANFVDGGIDDSFLRATWQAWLLENSKITRLNSPKIPGLNPQRAIIPLDAQVIIWPKALRGKNHLYCHGDHDAVTSIPYRFVHKQKNNSTQVSQLSFLRLETEGRSEASLWPAWIPCRSCKSCK